MSNLFYRNRRLLVLLIALITVSGLSSYYVLPRMEDPLLTPRFALINTLFPGADAQRVESLITEKIEEELRDVEQIKELRSTSRAGVSTITVELRDDVYDAAPIWSRIRDRLGDAETQLPEAAGKPDFDELNVRAYAMIVALSSGNSGSPEFAILRRLAEELEDELRLVTGTEDVDLFGDPDEEFVATIRPGALAAVGLSAADVARQLAASDAKVAAGMMRGTNEDLLFEVDSELDSLARIGRTPIQTGPDGKIVQLADVATIEKGIVQPPRSLAVIGGKPGIALGILVREHVRIDHWNASAHSALEAFENRLPAGIELVTVFEQNRYVAERLTSLLDNLLLGGAAVVVVVLVMMGWRNALVVAATLPLSAFAVLTGIRLLGIPIHQMSVTGLILALGLLIDNAIVIVDEVSDRLRRNIPAATAVSQSVRHLAVPLFGSTLTTALAFAPIMLMEGPAGEFVGAIAVSVVLAIVSSLLLALTVTPALTALFTSPAGETSPRRWWRDGLGSTRLAGLYRASLDTLFARPYLGIVLGVALPIAGFVQAARLTEQFFPPADRDQFQIELELPPQASLAEALELIGEVRERALARKEIVEVHWFLGESAPTFYYNVVPRRKNTSYYAQALVQLTSAENTRALIHELQRDFDTRFGKARLLVRQLEQGPPFDAPIEVRLFGNSMEKLQDLGDEIRAILAATPGVIHTRSEISDVVPKLSLQVDEHQARLAGLDHRVVADQLSTTLEGTLGGSVLEATEELPVRVRLTNEDRSDLSRIASLELVASRPLPNRVDYAGIPLSAVAHLALEPEIATVQRLDGQRLNEIQAFLPAGVLPADILAEFQRRLEASDVRLPSGYAIRYGGEAAKRDEAVGNLLANAGVLAVLMVATLVLSFGSFRIAAIIGVVAGLSAGLGTGALWVFGYPFGFMAIVGTMGLIGVAINDAIVVMAALREDQQARQGDRCAVRNVVVHSTRHVVATSLTTMAGFTPLILAGGGFWPPLAVAIAGGVGGATLLALYFVPSAFLLVSPECRAVSRELRNPSQDAHPAVAAAGQLAGA